MSWILNEADLPAVVVGAKSRLTAQALPAGRLAPEQESAMIWNSLEFGPLRATLETCSGKDPVLVRLTVCEGLVVPTI